MSRLEKQAHTNTTTISYEAYVGRVVYIEFRQMNVRVLCTGIAFFFLLLTAHRSCITNVGLIPR